MKIKMDPIELLKAIVILHRIVEKGSGHQYIREEDIEIFRKLIETLRELQRVINGG